MRQILRPLSIATIAMALLPAGDVRAGLISYWTLDGNLDDATVSDNDGSFGESGAAPFVEGVEAQAVSLDGATHHVAFRHQDGLPISGHPRYTVSFWVRGDPQTNRVVFSESATAGGQAFFSLATRIGGGSGELDIRIDGEDGGALFSGRSSTIVFDGEWHHVAWSDNLGDAALYIDGIRDATDFGHAPIALNLGQTTLGARLGGGPCCFFAGEIDEVRVHDHALTEFEVQALLESPDGCPVAGDTHCVQLALDPAPDSNSVFVAHALDPVDDSGDPIRFFYLLENDRGEVIHIGPKLENFTEISLESGTWTVSVTVDDDEGCFDLADDATRTAGPIVVGCPERGDTHCAGMRVTAPTEAEPGRWIFHVDDAFDESGDPILYSLTAENDGGRVLRLGPQDSSRFVAHLGDGSWVVTVEVDDDIDCDDIADDAVCTTVIDVGCPTEGDTTCNDMIIEVPTGRTPGRYDVSVFDAHDDSDDEITYTFRVERDGALHERGPQPESSTVFILDEGEWTITASVDDDPGCQDRHVDSTCSETLTVVAEAPRAISYWSFDDTLTDELESGNDAATIGKGVLEFSEGFDGTPRGAIFVDGDEMCLDLRQRSGLPLRAHRTHSVALWVLGFPQSGGVVWAEASTRSNTAVFSIGADPDGRTGKVSVLLRDARGRASINRVQSSLDAFDGEWHHIAWIDDGGRAALWIDGVRDPTDFSYARGQVDVDRSSIGCALGSERRRLFRGRIDDVRVWSHALDEAEILALVPEPDDCPDVGDTRCGSIEIDQPDGGGEGDYAVRAIDATDDSGDPVLYTFSAQDGRGAWLQSGPGFASNATFSLTEGDWTLAVLVDDDLRCRDVAEGARCETRIVVTRASGGLVSRWPFDGDLLDAEAGGNDGELVGEPVPVFVPDRHGREGSALSLGGVQELVSVGTADRLPIHATRRYTVAMWLRGGEQDRKVVWAETSSTSDMPLVAIGPDSRASAGTVEVTIRSPLGVDLVQHVHSAGIAFDGSWHHIAWVDDEGDASLWIDGVRDSADFSYDWQALGLDRTTIGGQVGARDPSCCFFEGDLDDVRVYNRALSGEEIAEFAEISIDQQFRRGDSNDDGSVDLTDGVFVLNYLFLGGPAPECLDAANTNADENIDLADGVFVLNYLFLGGPPPPAPGPDRCDEMPGLGCESFESC